MSGGDVSSRHLPDERATLAFAAELAGMLRAGDVVALEGELGAGKTTLVRGIVHALGGRAEDVSSPTYVLLHVYDTPRLKVFHLDAYRVDAGEMEAIGFEELLQQGGVVIVEWASRVKELLPAGTMHLRLTYEENGRRIEVRTADRRLL